MECVLIKERLSTLDILCLRGTCVCDLLCVLLMYHQVTGSHAIDQLLLNITSIAEHKTVTCVRSPFWGMFFFLHRRSLRDEKLL